MFIFYISWHQLRFEDCTESKNSASVPVFLRSGDTINVWHNVSLRGKRIINRVVQHRLRSTDSQLYHTNNHIKWVIVYVWSNVFVTLFVALICVELGKFTLALPSLLWVGSISWMISWPPWLLLWNESFSHDRLGSTFVFPRARPNVIQKEITSVVTLLHFYVGLKELKLDIGYRDSLKLH